MASVSPEIGWVSTNGLSLRFLSWGRLDAPAIIMLHGLRSYAYTWEPVALELLDTWRVIALDQRGRGESDWDPRRNYTTDAYVEDLQALVEHLRLKTFVLIGHSMGGTNAITYAAHNPDRVAALIVEDMGPGASARSNGASRILQELRETPGSFDTWDDAAAFWRKIRPDVSEDAIRSLVTHSLRQTEEGRVVWRYDADGIAEARINLPAIDLWPHVDALRMPTLLIRGASSDLLTADIAAEMCKRNGCITRVDLPGTHYVHDDNLDGFNAAVKTFLTAQRSADTRC